MEDRETPWMHKYGESKMTQIMMATICHVTSSLGLSGHLIFVEQRVQLKLIGGCSQVKILQQLERNHHRHLVTCDTDVLHWSIPTAKNFFRLLLKPQHIIVWPKWRAFLACLMLSIDVKIAWHVVGPVWVNSLMASHCCTAVPMPI